MKFLTTARQKIITLGIHHHIEGDLTRLNKDFHAIRPYALKSTWLNLRARLLFAQSACICKGLKFRFKLRYNDSICVNSTSILLYIRWYQLTPYKACVFLPWLV